MMEGSTDKTNRASFQQRGLSAWGGF